jgi:trans-2,3-dihydro-3-hydroxyanthranilate isomerase
MVPLRSLERVAALAPDFERLKAFEKRFQLDGCYVFVLKASDPEASVHARFFIPSAGVPEDPATGSAAGALGAYLVANRVFGSKTLVSFNIEQGSEIGRPSLITVTVHQDRGVPDLVKVGGTAVTVLNGEISL